MKTDRETDMEIKTERQVDVDMYVDMTTEERGIERQTELCSRHRQDDRIERQQKGRDSESERGIEREKQRGSHREIGRAGRRRERRSQDWRGGSSEPFGYSCH